MGKSAYAFILVPDHVISLFAHKLSMFYSLLKLFFFVRVPQIILFLLNQTNIFSLAVLSNSNGTGIIVHRLKKRTGGYVYLQSAGCLQYDRVTGQVDHFICVSRHLQ